MFSASRWLGTEQIRGKVSDCSPRGTVFGFVFWLLFPLFVFCLFVINFCLFKLCFLKKNWGALIIGNRVNFFFKFKTVTVCLLVVWVAKVYWSESGQEIDGIFQLESLRMIQ